MTTAAIRTIPDLQAFGAQPFAGASALAVFGDPAVTVQAEIITTPAGFVTIGSATQFTAGANAYLTTTSLYPTSATQLVAVFRGISDTGGAFVGILNTSLVSRKAGVFLGNQTIANSWFICSDPAATGVQAFAIVDNAASTRFSIDAAGKVAIGNGAPDASALLDLQSTTLGLLPPRLTTTQRNAIVTPAAGLIITNTTTNHPECNVGTSAAPVWGQMGVQTGSGAIVNGILAVAGVTLQANSVIAISVGSPVPGAGSLTIRYDVLNASRTTGVQTGSFTISALVAAGTLNALDQSTNVRWAILG